MAKEEKITPFIVFKCLGNICRSPAAEVILKHKRPEWRVLSVASTRNTIGQLIHFSMVSELIKNGYKKFDSHRPVLYEGWRRDDLARADFVFDLHRDGLSDPYVTGDFEASLQEIEDFVNQVIEVIEDGSVSGN